MVPVAILRLAPWAKRRRRCRGLGHGERPSLTLMGRCPRLITSSPSGADCVLPFESSLARELQPCYLKTSLALSDDRRSKGSLSTRTAECSISNTRRCSRERRVGVTT